DAAADARREVRTAWLSPLVSGPAAVDYQSGAGHKARVVRRQEHDAFGDVVGHTQPADRVQPQRGLARLLGVVGADLFGAHHEGLVAHVGLDQAGMDRVDPNAVALATEL